MKRLVAPLAAVAAALSGCASKDGSGEPNPIDVYMEARFESEGITPVDASKAELCRRLAADLIGRYLTAAEVDDECRGSVKDIVKRFQSRPEYLVVSERHWRDRFDTSDVNVDWRQLKDLYAKVDALHRGDLRYDEFAIDAMSHPGFVMNVFQPEEKVQGVFRAFMGRTPTEAEAADFSALYRPWIPSFEYDPDVPYIYVIGARIFPVLCEPITNCSTTLFGGGALDLSSIPDPTFQGVLWESLTEAQKDALREPGRILTAQPFFYEAAADEILNRLLGWSDGGRFPREPGIVLPHVREIVADYLRETQSYPATERLVLTSWLYRMRAEVADDGHGDNPTAPVPAIYATGPVKGASAEVWLDSAAALTLDLGACDPRYSDGFPYFLILNALQDGQVGEAQARADLRKIYDLQENRMPWNEEDGIPDFTYQFVARLIGGCPGFGQMRQEQTGLSYAFTQETLAELLCQPGVAQNTGSGGTIEDIVRHQVRIAFGREATAEDVSDYATAAASCSGEECTPAGMRNAVCVGLLGGAPMIFY